MICCFSDKCLSREAKRHIHYQKGATYLNFLLQESCQNVTLSMRITFICNSSLDADYFDPTSVQEGCTLVFKLHTPMVCQKKIDKYDVLSRTVVCLL